MGDPLLGLSVPGEQITKPIMVTGVTRVMNQGLSIFCRGIGNMSHRLQQVAVCSKDPSVIRFKAKRLFKQTGRFGPIADFPMQQRQMIIIVTIIIADFDQTPQHTFCRRKIALRLVNLPQQIMRSDILWIHRQSTGQQHDSLIQVACLPGNLAQIQKCGSVTRPGRQNLSIQADRLAEFSQLMMTPGLLVQQAGSCLRLHPSVHCQPHPCFWAQKIAFNPLNDKRNTLGYSLHPWN